jgi:hypothetical protein
VIRDRILSQFELLTQEKILLMDYKKDVGQSLGVLEGRQNDESKHPHRYQVLSYLHMKNTLASTPFAQPS